MGTRLLYVMSLSLTFLVMPWYAIANTTGLHQDFLDAEKLLKSRNYTGFKQKLSSLDHPLTPYLESDYIYRHFYTRPDDKIQAFLRTHSNTPAADQLKRKWLFYLARKNDWKRFNQYYTPSNSLTLRCHHAHSLNKTNRHFEAITEGQRLWLLGDPLPKACDKVFQHWQRKGLLSQDLIWQRFLKSVDKRHYRLARYLQKMLSSEYQKHAKLVRSLWRKPWNILSNEAAIELPNDARYLLAKRSILRQKNEIDPSHPILNFFSQTQLERIQKETITTMASKGEEDAFFWYQLASKHKLIDTKMEHAFLHGAVQNSNWFVYTHLFKLASPNIQRDSQWQYWQGRALQMMGANTNQVQYYLAEAAKNRDYYGFMASQQLGQKANMNHRSIDIAPSKIQTVRLDHSIKRALAFFELNRIPQARREWRYAMEQHDESGQLAMALVAGRHGWADRAIMTLAKVKNWDDLQLRFPLAHLEAFSSAAQKHHISQNWIYGIARQESAFMHDAKSSAGATGLMQLMPATAKGISRKIRVRYNYGSLIKPDYNIHLGSGYLKQLAKRFNNNKVLATASYNAGPTNVKRWLKRNQGPIDQWIENIPFSETREYVKRVLTYSVIYSYRLGQQQPILDYDTLASWQSKNTQLQISLLKSKQNKQG
ncbi:transglycosylase SLT domain-containing protein [Bermanella marisrubri]|uniref:Soluble lytic murein transglycosylase, putative n=1 Tax=Bermanella marisrubri TaxID=207949 RepID=Q1N4S7_9GAMM|nr:transglycosylase SLT domain-containing protein [Bermanella marisrubri]EAT13351.1 soluble lytic murein transglycosylase, putative [Oceanobacter sp. RED65] [Bermanella marisrubri]QIZ84107.1 transglycosylase SLT domain-containing protein [Bermanella marisrubri]